MRFNKYRSKLHNLKEYSGDFLRIGSALGIVGEATNWYYNVRGEVLNEVIDNIGRDLTSTIDETFGVYGFGEALNTYKDFRNGEPKNLLEYSGKIAKVAPLSSPFLSMATNGDFFSSILIPAGICISGWASDSFGEYLRKKDINKEKD